MHVHVHLCAPLSTPAVNPCRCRVLAQLAVRRLDLGIERGECFGLLGPNGAGKSTSINMLVGLLAPSAGTALIGGHDLNDDMGPIYSLMGVCPQHDLLWESLTGREHLLFYGRLKGLRGEQGAAKGGQQGQPRAQPCRVHSMHAVIQQQH